MDRHVHKPKAIRPQLDAGLVISTIKYAVFGGVSRSIHCTVLVSSGSSQEPNTRVKACLEANSKPQIGF
jgi:hypothetical protein